MRFLFYISIFLHASLTRDLKLSPLGTFTLKTSAFRNFDLRMSYSKLLNASSKRGGSVICINYTHFQLNIHYNLFDIIKYFHCRLESPRRLMDFAEEKKNEKLYVKVIYRYLSLINFCHSI